MATECSTVSNLSPDGFSDENGNKNSSISGDEAKGNEEEEDDDNLNASPPAFTARDSRGTFGFGDSMMLRINVGGSSYRMRFCSILKLPMSRLAKLCMAETDKARLDYSDGFLEDADEYYFERSPYMFEYLMLAYRTQEVHMPETICPRAFLGEMIYWMLDRSLLPNCCSDTIKDMEVSLPAASSNFGGGVVPNNASKLSPTSSNYYTLPMGTDRTQKSEDNQSPPSEPDPPLSKDLVDIDPVDCEKNEFSDLRCGYTRQAAWQFLEVPSSSIAAMAFMVVSCVFIMATVIVLLMGSVKDFQVIDPITNTTDAIPELEIADAVCVVWFTLEYIVRLWAAPQRMEYVKSALSIIDLLACAPFYLEQLFSMFGVKSKSFADFRRSLVPIRILRVMRVLRVLRVLKVARYSRGFQSMGQTLLRSWRELLLLILFMLTTNVMFSTAMYFLEADTQGSMFYSIPQAAWWCVITMTTVGYGDVYPVTAVGKLLAGFVSISGIILLAFPISVIVENFNQEYHPQDQEGGGAEDAHLHHHEALGPLLSAGGGGGEHRLPSGSLATVNSMRVIDGKMYVEVSSPTVPKKRRAHMKAF